MIVFAYLVFWNCLTGIIKSVDQGFQKVFCISERITQPAFTCSKSVMKTPEQYVKYAQS